MTRLFRLILFVNFCISAACPIIAEDYVLTLYPDQVKPAILKYGITFDDINAASDGGLYHELLGNRDFELNNDIRKGWNTGSFWTISGEGAGMRFVLNHPIHPDNPNSVIFSAGDDPAMLRNRGLNGNCFASFDNRNYHFSCMARNLSQEDSVPLSVRMVDPDRGTLYGETKITVTSRDWAKLECIVHVEKGFYLNGLELMLTQPHTSVQLDMLSLKELPFYKNHPDGLRNNIATDIESLHPDFFRFPGENLLQGNSLSNMYRWKNTIGPLETRIRQRNVTDSYPYEQTSGLGFYELFQFAEDIGAEPLPVYSVGVSGSLGRNQKIPMRNMKMYAQDLTDLLDYAFGKPESSKWAAERVKAGHPDAFPVKTIQIFCPTFFSNTYKERCEILADAVKRYKREVSLIFDAGSLWNTDLLKSAVSFAKERKASSISLPLPENFTRESIDMVSAYLESYDENQPKLAFFSLRNRDKFLFSAMLMTLEHHADIVAYCAVASVLGRNDPGACVTFNRDGVSKLTEIGDVFRIISQSRGDTIVASELKTKLPIIWSVQKNSVTNELILKFTNLGSSSGKVKIAGLQGKWQYTCIYRSDRMNEMPETHDFNGSLDLQNRSIFIYKLIPITSQQKT